MILQVTYSEAGDDALLHPLVEELHVFLAVLQDIPHLQINQPTSQHQMVVILDKHWICKIAQKF
jgi:hypothetical protein